MELLVVRHAAAEDRLVWAERGRDEDERPLTARGRRRMRRAARGLRTLIPQLDVLATSPLVRAVQTARIVTEEYSCADAIELDALAPGMLPDQVATWLETQPEDATVALFGHEPGASELISWLLAGRTTPFSPLKKGGACLLDLSQGIGAGRGQLVWFLPPRVLRALAR